MSDLTEKTNCRPPDNSTICCEISPMPEDPTLAFAYIKFQYPSEIYDSKQALARGTVFPCLDRPYKYSPAEGRICCEGN